MFPWAVCVRKPKENKLQLQKQNFLVTQMLALGCSTLKIKQDCLKMSGCFKIAQSSLKFLKLLSNFSRL